jgi:DNA polymerase-3 subunit alpha
MTKDINDFTHLHTHSTYSILDGENQLEALVNRVKESGMKQVALTDHGTMMGSLNFYKACKAAGIKPILGVEAYITNDLDDAEEKTRDNNHLVMVAINKTGYLNLLNLVSKAQLQNFYFKPRISKHNLTAETTEGIIATSACLGNEVNRVGGWDLETKTYTQREAMEAAAASYKAIFGDRYYLEIQDNDDPVGQQLIYNQIVIDIAKNQHIKNVITADAHYTDVKSVDLHAMLMAMQLKKTYTEYMAAGEMKYGPWFFVRTPQQMLEASIKHKCEEAFWNACDIGNQCSIEIELGKYKNPIFDITNEVDYADFLKECL